MMTHTKFPPYWGYQMVSTHRQRDNLIQDRRSVIDRHRRLREAVAAVGGEVSGGEQEGGWLGGIKTSYSGILRSDGTGTALVFGGKVAIVGSFVVLDADTESE